MEQSNRQIAKNAVALYIRMAVMMLIGLYTSRVMLQALGVTDYGIYNLVGGFVSMFGIISSSILSSISRSLTFELGTGNKDRLSKIFSTSILVLVVLIAILVVLMESVGVWYLTNKMVIPADRLTAAHWCFQLSMLIFVLGMINSPYSASVLSHERMGAYAAFSIVDAVLRLAICFVVIYSSIDHLVMYASLLCGVGLINLTIYVTYCKRNFEECTFKWTFERKLFQELFSFAGWNFIGCSAAVLRLQGAALLLNFAGGPVVNAANGIANSVNNSMNNFVNSFTQAFNPQITKRFAKGEYDALMQLLIFGSKYSYYLLFLIALPIGLNTDFILKIWLGIVPEHTVMFVRLSILFLLAEAVSRPIITAKSATGRIRNYQLVVGGILLLMLPMSWVGIKAGLPVEVVPLCNVITAVMAIFARMYMLRGDFPCWSSMLFMRKVLLNVLCVSVVSSIFPYLVHCLFEEGWLNLITTTASSLICVSVAVLYVGCGKDERASILSKFRNILSKLGL